MLAAASISARLPRFATGNHQRSFGGRQRRRGLACEVFLHIACDVRFDRLRDSEAGLRQIQSCAVACRGGQFVEARAGNGGDEQRALRRLTVAAHASILPLRNASIVRHVERDATRRLPHGQRQPRCGIGDVLAEHEHGIRPFDFGERRNAKAASAVSRQRRVYGLRLVVGETRAEIVGADQLLEREVRFQRGARRTDADQIRVLSRHDGAQRRVSPRRLEHVVLAAHAGVANALLMIHEVRAVAPLVAQKVAVDLAVVAVVNTLQHAVAFGGKGVAAHRAMRTHRRRGLQIPLAAVRPWKTACR